MSLPSFFDLLDGHNGPQPTVESPGIYQETIPPFDGTNIQDIPPSIRYALYPIPEGEGEVPVTPTFVWSPTTSSHSEPNEKRTVEEDVVGLKQETPVPQVPMMHPMPQMPPLPPLVPLHQMAPMGQLPQLAAVPQMGPVPPLPPLPPLDPVTQLPRVSPLVQLPQVTPGPGATPVVQVPQAPQMHPMPQVPRVNTMPQVPRVNPLPHVHRVNPMPQVPRVSPVPQVPRVSQVHQAPRVSPVPQAHRPNPVHQAPRGNPARPVNPGTQVLSPERTMIIQLQEEVTTELNKFRAMALSWYREKAAMQGDQRELSKQLAIAQDETIRLRREVAMMKLEEANFHKAAQEFKDTQCRLRDTFLKLREKDEEVTFLSQELRNLQPRLFRLRTADRTIKKLEDEVLRLRPLELELQVRRQEIERLHRDKAQIHYLKLELEACQRLCKQICWAAAKARAAETRAPAGAPGEYRARPNMYLEGRGNRRAHPFGMNGVGNTYSCATQGRGRRATL